MVSLEILISATIVATIVISIALLVSQVVLRKSSSSVRHIVWLLALVGILIGPVLSVVATNSPFRIDASFLLADSEPIWAPVEQQRTAGVEESPVLNQSIDHADGVQLERSFDSTRRKSGQSLDVSTTPEPANPESDQHAVAPVVPAIAPARASMEPAVVTVRSWVFTAGFVWMVVTVGIFCLALAAQFALVIKRHRYQEVTDVATLQMCRDVMRQLGIRRDITLLEAESNAMPMTWGVFRPVLLLPASAHEWSAERMRMVLLHELAHVRRYDCLWQTVSAFAIACHWFNPLVWLAAWRLRSECERACDDVVLSSGVAASNYAEQLLDISTGGRRGVLAMCAGLAMARSRRLAGRLQAIVDDERERGSASRRRLIAAVFASAIMLIPISMTARVTIAAQTDDLVQEVAKTEASEKPATEKARPDKAAPPVADAPDVADPYNTLYDVLMTRWKDGKSYAQNETSPAIFSWSEFPFDDSTFEKFNSAMDAFAALPQTQIETYSDVKRALLQRHLWKVFDTTFNWDWSGDWYWGGRKSFPKTHMERRTALQPKIASLMRRLALTKEQILALPNPMAATVKSGGFAQAHDPADRFKPFLPADLYAKESSWICLGEDEHPIPASQHTSKLYSRSMFLQFMRLPNGRTETLEYMERIKKRPHQFPAGTQFALIEQPFLISEEGELVLSPMITSIQLRAYLNVGRRFSSSNNDPQITQCVAEFVMQPRQLMKGNAVMRALGPDDFRYGAGAPFAAGFSPKDPFATGDIAGRMPQTTRLNLCMSCHGRAGGRGVMTESFQVTNVFKETGIEDVSKATSAQKLADDQWKALQSLWQGKSLPQVDDQKMAAKDAPENKSEEELDKFPDTPELRTALTQHIEREVAAELRNLHTATLRAEVGKLSEMFQLEETESDRLRVAAGGAAENAVEKTRDTLKAAANRSIGYLLNRGDIDMTAFSLNGRYIRFAPAPKILDSIKKTKVKNGSYIDAATDRWVDTNVSAKVKRRAAKVSMTIGFYGSFGNPVGPKDADVLSEEIWRETLSDILTEEQRTQYTKHLESRFKSTFLDVMLTALQFDLNLPDSQLPIVRQRLEERVNPEPARTQWIESTVGRDLQRVKAEGLAGILTKKQLDHFPEHPDSRIKSTIITLILKVLQFDLHLSDSQLPVVRKRLEERINPGPLSRSVESTALRVRWTLKAKDFADVLTEPQRTLWQLTQGE